MPKSLLLKLLVIFIAVIPISSQAQAPLKIVASIKPIHSLVAAVTDGVVYPQLLVSGAQSPHDYALRPSEAKKINEADVIFFVSKELETFLGNIVTTLDPKTEVVELANKGGILLFPIRQVRGHNHHDHHNFDPHIWLNPDNAVHIVNAILMTLSRKDPSNALSYQKNAAKIIMEIQKEAARIRKELNPYKTAPYIVFHDAYQYFERYYDIHSLGALALSEDQAPSAKRIKEVHELIDKYQAKCLFTEPQFSSDIAESIRKDKKIRIGLLDPLGVNIAPGKNAYINIMNYITNNITACLKNE